MTPKTSNPSQIVHSALHFKIALVSLTGPKTLPDFSMRTHILTLQNKKGSFKDKTLLDNLLLSNQGPQYFIVYNHHLFFFFLIFPTCELIELILTLFFYLSCIPFGRLEARDGSQPLGLSSPHSLCTWFHHLDNQASYTVTQEHENDCQALAEGWFLELVQPCLGCILLG